MAPHRTVTLFVPETFWVQPYDSETVLCTPSMVSLVFQPQFWWKNKRKQGYVQKGGVGRTCAGYPPWARVRAPIEPEGAIFQGFSKVDAQLSGSDFLLGGKLTLADLTAFVVVNQFRSGMLDGVPKE